MRHFTLIVIVLFTLQFCREIPHFNTTQSKKDSSLTSLFDTIYDKDKFESEQIFIQHKKEICKRLALYDLEDGTDSFELRIWTIPSIWEPNKLYILKGIDSTWTFFHYQYYRKHSRTDNEEYRIWDDFKYPKIDSVHLITLNPQKTNWSSYIVSLSIDSLWNLKSESQIANHSFGGTDGYRVLLEIRDRGKYKYLFYTTPDYYSRKNINHKKFMEFKDRLTIPLAYNGIRNL